MGRLTIDEVIAHCERTTKNTELIMQKIPADNKYYWEHKQTAEWLRELKRYKDLEEAGRLVELPEVFDEKKLFRVLSYSACPNVFNLPRSEKCPVIPYKDCWENALKIKE